MENLFTNRKIYITNNQYIKTRKWKTFKSLKTFFFFILIIQRTSIVLQKHL